MVQWKKSRARALTGRKVPREGKKEKSEMGGEEIRCKIGERKLKFKRGRGGSLIPRLLSINVANVYDPKTKKYEKLEILGVEENPASRHYVRMGIITRGTIIRTSKGLARVTNRPSREGFVNAVLIS
ncbi:MAG: 30S ribosomal protein S8e [Candidatus Nanoarchaeia archaeon]|nr:30S ribosomal protein S8e [Candidatus Haiyanarchaeum thermophilum]MCW1302847.1 30S ribosomal protein S8e [Candidatus Haiyanarchaeum thermophilum]MCW1306707.1 30S ribosomal protein S8e [Candidatus Haiyanarchaeum thermophilum]